MNAQATVRRTMRTAATAVIVCVALLLMVGCGGGLGVDGGGGTGPAPATAPHGKVYGGQQPVVGAVIQLYAVNTTAAKGASVALISTTVTTDTNGGFTMPSFTCPAGAEVYLTATGGDPGGGVNSGLVLLAALGPCTSLTASTFVNVNELTTVGGVYALAPFMADATHIGATAATAQGLAKAFDTAQALVDFASGSAPGPKLPANVTAPTAKLITLADAMAACVNSATGSPACSTFYGAATPPGGSAPTDTVSALLNIAHYPANHVATIFGLITPSAPFETPMASSPSDWTMTMSISGGGLNAPYALAVDGSGNVWVADEGALAVSKFNSLGMAISGNSGITGGGLLAPQSIAVDLNGNVWVANTGGSSVVELDSNGNVLSGSGGFTTGGINAPTGIAVDKHGNAWVANFGGDSITELSPAGAGMNGSPIVETTGAAPVSIALDPSGNVWVDNNGTGTVGKFDGNGVAASGSPFTDGYLQGGEQIALTSTSAVWVAAPGNNTLSVFAANGSAQSFSPVSGGGMSLPSAIAADGANSLWIANGTSTGTLSSFTSAGVATTVSGIGSVNTPQGVAIDGSGNVWTANAGDNTLTEFVGLASPVVTPLAANLQ